MRSGQWAASADNDSELTPPSGSIFMGLDYHRYEVIDNGDESDAGRCERFTSRATTSGGRISRAATLRRYGAMLAAVGFLATVWSQLQWAGEAGGLTVEGGLPDYDKVERLGVEGGGGDSLPTQVLVTNSYQRSEFTATRMYPWEHMAEPARATRFDIVRWPVVGEAAEQNFM